MTIRDQIAAARALADDWATESGVVRNEVETMATLLERARELLALCDGWISLRQSEHARRVAHEQAEET